MARLDAILRRTEEMAVSGTEGHWALIPPELVHRLRPRVARVGDGVLTMMERSDSLQMNRVIGLGHRGGAKEAMVDEIIEQYRASRRKRFSVIVGPGPQAEEISGWLLKRGFVRRHGRTLLLRDCRKAIPTVPRGVRVARARRKDRSKVIRIQAETFGTPASRRAWSMAAVAAPDYEHYLAFVGASPVAVGALRAVDSLAWLGGGATLSRWRRRGAQGSLIAARLRRGARLGCAWAWSETALPGPGRPQGSFRNLIRFGFELVYRKPAFLWRAR